MGLVDLLRSGDWLTRSRMRAWASVVLVVSAGAFAFMVATADGINDYQGRPLGTDFSNVYAAGTYVLEGRAEAPFDWSLQHAREKEIFGAGTPFFGWHYPPFFLFIAAALALMPYGLALAVWQGVTLALYLLSIRAVLSSARGADALAATPDPLWLLFALAYPAVLVNLGHGHNGFLTAAMFAGALVLLDRRPVVAGLLFGALAYKPQFGVLIPLVLIATGRWRAFAAAAAAVVALIGVATLVFGPDIWEAFLAGSRLTRAIVLEQGDTGWEKIQSLFAWARMWGGPVSLAYAVQGGAALILAAVIVWIWRGPAAYPLKAAALLIAAILATPYSLDYDLMVLAPAIAFIVVHGCERGFAPYEKTAIACLWLVPLIARGVAGATWIPIGVIAMLTVFTLIVCRVKGHGGAANIALAGRDR